MRLFAAIDLPAQARERVAAVQTKLAETKADVRWVVPANLHITVKFFGEVEESRVGE